MTFTKVNINISHCILYAAGSIGVILMTAWTHNCDWPSGTSRAAFVYWICHVAWSQPIRVAHFSDHTTRISVTFLTPDYQDQNAAGPTVPVFLVLDPSSQMCNPSLIKTQLSVQFYQSDRMNKHMLYVYVIRCIPYAIYRHIYTVFRIKGTGNILEIISTNSNTWTYVLTSTKYNA